jgi:hypothetical protein
LLNHTGGVNRHVAAIGLLVFDFAGRIHGVLRCGFRSMNNSIRLIGHTKIVLLR